MLRNFKSFKPLLVLCVVALVSQGSIASANFTDNTSVPTTDNVPLPLNTSDTFQIKQGGLRVTDELQAPSLVDINNFGFYVDPNGTSRLNYTITNNAYNYGSFTTNIIYDTSNSAFYLNPDGTSVTNVMFSALIRDIDNGGYYLNLNGNSRIANIYADYLRIYNHIRTPDIYIENARAWASQLGQIQVEIRGASASGREFSQPLGVSCRAGWRLVGCSGFQGDCEESDCGYHGIIPSGNTCRAYYDDDDRGPATNLVHAYCIR